MAYYTKAERRAYYRGAIKSEKQLAAMVAEVARLEQAHNLWRIQSIENWQAFCAMRNSINEYIPLPSLESDLLHGPEFSINCMILAECIIKHERERDIKYQWRQTYLYKILKRLLTFLAR